MTSISIRKLDKGVYKALRIQATNHGLSMEEEVRRIISKAVSSSEKILDIFKTHFGPKNGIDLSKHIRSTKKPHSPIDFNE